MAKKKSKPPKLVPLCGYMRLKPDRKQDFQGWQIRVVKDKDHTVPVTIVLGHRR